MNTKTSLFYFTCSASVFSMALLWEFSLASLMKTR